MHSPSNVTHQPMPRKAHSHAPYQHAEMIHYTTIDFFNQFVKDADKKGLLRTPLPLSLTKEHIMVTSVQLLHAAKLGKGDVIVKNDDSGGNILITPNGIAQIESFLHRRHQEKSATVIQTNWRAYRAKKLLQNELKSQPLEKNVVHSDETNYLYYEKYIQNISDIYLRILNSSRLSISDSPNEAEVEFMKKLNHPESYRVCQEYLIQLANFGNGLDVPNSNRISMPGNVEYQNSWRLYYEYAPRVLEWIGKVLKLRFKPNQDFLYIVRSGDILCRLACVLYQDINCHLLEKNFEYGLHKIIFFLELCKSLHIKRSLLFTISDLLVWPEHDYYKKHALIVVRTVIALEKRARKSGWQGPVLDFSATEKLDLSTRESVGSKNHSQVGNNKSRFTIVVESEPNHAGSIETKSSSDNVASEKLEENHQFESAIRDVLEDLNDDFPSSIDYGETISEYYTQGNFHTLDRNEDGVEIQDPKTVLVDAIKQRIQSRTESISYFMTEEKTYAANLTLIKDYINTIIKRRKRTSSLIPGAGESDPTSHPSPLNVSLTGNSGRLKNESEQAYKFRLETETEELGKLSEIIHQILIVHDDLVNELDRSWNEEASTFIIGDILTKFNRKLMPPYSAYAVVALSGMNKANLELTNRGDLEHSEFVNQIVSKYVANPASTSEPTEQDWGWFLHRPIHRLSSYPVVLSDICGDEKLTPLVNEDNRKLRLAGVKLECTSIAIMNHLKKAGYQY